MENLRNSVSGKILGNTEDTVLLLGDFTLVKHVYM